MLQALLTPVELLLRRITFISSACIILFTSCAGIPDQDACIEIDAAKNDQRIFTVDTTRAYDTIASTLQYNIHYRNGSPAANWPVTFYIDSVKTPKRTDRSGRTEPVWVNGGTYSMTIGNPNEYPCIVIHNLYITGGRGCEINVTLPTNE